MKPLPFTESLVREHATEKVFERGVRYAGTDAVHFPVRRGDTLTAEVYGTEPRPYQVRIALKGNGVDGVRCSCPYDWGGWCKHVVATLLVALDHPTAVDERPPFEQTLASLDHAALAALFAALAEAHPELVAEIEGRIDPMWERPPRPEDEWDSEGW